MSNYVKISTLVPASLEQIIDCATDYKSCSKSFLQNKSHSHGFGGELNQVPYINHDLIWLLQSSIIARRNDNRKIRTDTKRTFRGEFY